MRQNVGKNDEWFTPRWVIDFIRKEYNIEIDLDAASSIENSERLSIDYYFDKKINALDADWEVEAKDKINIWLNPPFTLKKQFLEKAVEEFKKGKIDNLFFLINADALTVNYAYDFLKPLQEKKLLNLIIPKGRINFINPDDPKKINSIFGSVIIHFTKNKNYGIKYVDFQKT